MTTIYVGNLPFTATEDEVRALFERHGKVESVKLINDRETGRPRGFAFVDMGAGEAQNAIQQTNGFQMGGRPLRVNEAQERALRRHAYFVDVPWDSENLYWDYQGMRKQFGPRELGSTGPIELPAAPHPWCAQSAGDVKDLVRFLLTL